VSGKEILGAENGGKLFGDRALPRTLGELTTLLGSSQRSPNPLTDGERVAAAPPHELYPRSRPFGLAPNEEFWTRRRPL